MERLPIPQEPPGSTYRRCVAFRPDPPRTPLRGLATYVTARATTYNQLAGEGRLSELQQQNTIHLAGLQAEVLGLYSSCLVRGRLRNDYDNHVLSAKNGRCPLCGVGRVYTLDHYLPKALFPEISVEFRNLVPACRHCNTHKGTHTPASRDGELFHPFYDDWSDRQFLLAQVVMDVGVRVTYSIADIEAWADNERAKKHFQLLRLGALYTMNAANELAGMKPTFGHMYAAGGAPCLQDYLQQLAEGYSAASVNTWQASLYRALAASGDFVAGGYAAIGS